MHTFKLVFGTLVAARYDDIIQSYSLYILHPSWKKHFQLNFRFCSGTDCRSILDVVPLADMQAEKCTDL